MFRDALLRINFNLQILKLNSSYDNPRQCIKKQRYYIANKGPYSQSYGFPIADPLETLRTASLEKTLMLGKIEGRGEKETTEAEMVGWHHD